MGGAQERPSVSIVELPIFSAPAAVVPAGEKSKDFYLRLPEHVAFREGSELLMSLHPPLGVPVFKGSLVVAFNERVLLQTNFAAVTFPADEEALLSFRVAVPASVVAREWNKVSLRFGGGQSADAASSSDVARTWTLRQPECFLSLAYARQPLFPELTRFPHPLAEEKLLRPGVASPFLDDSAAMISILLPGRSRDVHLRAAAIVAGRLGQLDYLEETDCRMQPIEAWKLESQARNVVLIGRRDQLGGIDFPADVAATLASLRPGQGMLAEFIHGDGRRSQRAVVVTGADDAGLEKAALTLGSRPALAEIPPSPAVIEAAPEFPASLEGGTEPGDRRAASQALSQVQNVLRADRFARRAAYVLPAGSSLDQVRGLLGVWMELGRGLPTAPILWPDVVTYGANAPLLSPRLKRRSVLLFGSVSQWAAVLPADAPWPALAMTSPDAEIISMQGRDYRVAAFEPTLVFAQSMPSPWSAEDTLVLVGGWKDYATPAARRLLLDPATVSGLRGELGAVDVLGRSVGYQLSGEKESFAEKLQSRVQAGLSAEASSRHVVALDERLAAAHRWNWILFYGFGGLLVALVLARLWLSQQHTRARQKVMARERAKGSVAFWLLLFVAGPAADLEAASFNASRPLAARGAGARTLVVYSATRSGYSTADELELLKLHLRRVATQIETASTTRVTTNQLAAADYLVVFNPQPNPDLGTNLWPVFWTTNKTVLWVGHGLEHINRLAELPSQFESAPTVPDRLTRVRYRNRDWPMPDEYWVPMRLAVQSSAQLLVEPLPPTGKDRPALAWRIGPVTCFAAVPSAGPLSWLFSDLLLDFYGVTSTATNRVYFRIDDYQAASSHREFARVADYLASRGHPFVLTVAPSWRNQATGKIENLDTAPEFAAGLRHAQARGGRIVLRGAVRESSGRGELWDFDLDRPSTNASPARVREGVESAIGLMLKHGLLPLAWQAPDGAASSAVCREVARVCSTVLERPQLSDATHLEKALLPAITQDQFGRQVVPENLGYVSDGVEDSLGELKQRAEFLAQLRGTTAGGFIHAYQPLEKFTRLVDALEADKTPFLDLASLDHWVHAPGSVLLTGRAERRVKLAGGIVTWKAFDHSGKLLATEQEFAVASERTLQRRGKEAIEVFEFRESIP